MKPIAGYFLYVMAIVLLALCMLTINGTAHAQRTVVRVFSTVKLVTPTGFKTSSFYGAGFYVRCNLIVTALHVVLGAHRVLIEGNGKQYSGRVVYESTKNDIALIKVYKRGKPFKICKNVLEGAQIDVMMITGGKLKSRRDNINIGTPHGYWSNVIVAVGDSGSPVLHKQCVAGMVVEARHNPDISKYEGFPALAAALKEYEGS